MDKDQEFTIEKQVFSIVKEKIIKTNELLQLFNEKNERLGRATQAFKRLKQTYENTLHEVNRLKLENDRFNDIVARLQPRNEQVEKELSAVKQDYAKLEETYQQILIKSQLSIGDLEEKVKQCTCNTDNLILSPSKKTTPDDKIKELKRKCTDLKEAEHTLTIQNNTLIRKIKCLEKKLEYKNNKSILKNELAAVKEKLKLAESSIKGESQLQASIESLKVQHKNEIDALKQEKAKLSLNVGTLEYLEIECKSLREELNSRNTVSLDFSTQTDPIPEKMCKKPKTCNVMTNTDPTNLQNLVPHNITMKTVDECISKKDFDVISEEIIETKPHREVEDELSDVDCSLSDIFKEMIFPIHLLSPMRLSTRSSEIRSPNILHLSEPIDSMDFIGDDLKGEKFSLSKLVPNIIITPPTPNVEVNNSSKVQFPVLTDLPVIQISEKSEQKKKKQVFDICIPNEAHPAEKDNIASIFEERITKIVDPQKGTETNIIKPLFINDNNSLLNNTSLLSVSSMDESITSNASFISSQDCKDITDSVVMKTSQVQDISKTTLLKENRSIFDERLINNITRVPDEAQNTSIKNDSKSEVFDICIPEANPAEKSNMASVFKERITKTVDPQKRTETNIKPLSLNDNNSLLSNTSLTTVSSMDESITSNASFISPQDCCKDSTDSVVMKTSQVQDISQTTLLKENRSIFDERLINNITRVPDEAQNTSIKNDFKSEVFDICIPEANPADKSNMASVFKERITKTVDPQKGTEANIKSLSINDNNSLLSDTSLTTVSSMDESITSNASSISLQDCKDSTNSVVMKTSEVEALNQKAPLKENISIFDERLVSDIARVPDEVQNNSIKSYSKTALGSLDLTLPQGLPNVLDIDGITSGVSIAVDNELEIVTNNSPANENHIIKTPTPLSQTVALSGPKQCSTPDKMTNHHSFLSSPSVEAISIIAAPNPIPQEEPATQNSHPSKSSEEKPPAVQRRRKYWIPYGMNPFVKAKPKPVKPRRITKKYKEYSARASATGKDTILDALKTLQQNNINFTISNESIPLGQSYTTCYSTLSPPKSETTLLQPRSYKNTFSSKLDCWNTNCTKENSLMMLRKTSPHEEPELLGFFSVKDELVTPSTSKMAFKETPQGKPDLRELVEQLLKEFARLKPKNFAENKRRKMSKSRSNKQSDFNSETESELERLFRKSADVLGRNRRMLAAAREQSLESNGESVAESESDIMADSGLVTATPKNDSDSLIDEELSTPLPNNISCNMPVQSETEGSQLNSCEKKRISDFSLCPTMLSPIAHHTKQNPNNKLQFSTPTPNLGSGSESNFSYFKVPKNVLAVNFLENKKPNIQDSNEDSLDSYKMSFCPAMVSPLASSTKSSPAESVKVDDKVSAVSLTQESPKHGTLPTFIGQIKSSLCQKITFDSLGSCEPVKLTGLEQVTSVMHSPPLSLTTVAAPISTSFSEDHVLALHLDKNIQNILSEKHADIQGEPEKNTMHIDLSIKSSDLNYTLNDINISQLDVSTMVPTVQDDKNIDDVVKLVTPDPCCSTIAEESKPESQSILIQEHGDQEELVKINLNVLKPKTRASKRKLEEAKDPPEGTNVSELPKKKNCDSESDADVLVGHSKKKRVETKTRMNLRSRRQTITCESVKDFSPSAMELSSAHTNMNQDSANAPHNESSTKDSEKTKVKSRVVKRGLIIKKKCVSKEYVSDSDSSDSDQVLSKYLPANRNRNRSESESKPEVKRNTMTDEEVDVNCDKHEFLGDLNLQNVKHSSTETSRNSTTETREISIVLAKESENELSQIVVKNNSLTAEPVHRNIDRNEVLKDFNLQGINQTPRTNLRSTTSEIQEMLRGLAGDSKKDPSWTVINGDFDPKSKNPPVSVKGSRVSQMDLFGECSSESSDCDDAKVPEKRLVTKPASKNKKHSLKSKMLKQVKGMVYAYGNKVSNNLSCGGGGDIEKSIELFNGSNNKSLGSSSGNSSEKDDKKKINIVQNILITKGKTIDLLPKGGPNTNAPDVSRERIRSPTTLTLTKVPQTYSRKRLRVSQINSKGAVKTPVGTPVDILSQVMQGMTRTGPRLQTKTNIVAATSNNTTTTTKLPCQYPLNSLRGNRNSLTRHHSQGSLRGTYVSGAQLLKETEVKVDEVADPYKDCPKSPEIPELPDRLPRLIPTEKPQTLAPSKAVSLMDKLMVFSHEPKLVDDIVREFGFQTVDYMVGIIIGKLSHDVHDKAEVTTPNSPPMTGTQRILLGFLCKLDKSTHPGILDSFLARAERELCNKRTSTLESVEPIARLYAAVCKMRQDLNRIRTFVCDCFYFTEDFAVPVLFAVLTVWPDVLANASDMSKYPLAKVIVQLSYLKECNQPGYNLLPLRDILHKYYEYPQERWNCDEVFQEVLVEYIRNPSMKLSEYALLIFLKNKPTKWVYQKIQDHLIPLYHLVPENNPNLKATLLIILLKICLSFRKYVDYDWSAILKMGNWINNELLKVEIHPIVTQALHFVRKGLPKKLKKKKVAKEDKNNTINEQVTISPKDSPEQKEDGKDGTKSTKNNIIMQSSRMSGECIEGNTLCKEYKLGLDDTSSGRLCINELSQPSEKSTRHKSGVSDEEDSDQSGPELMDLLQQRGSSSMNEVPPQPCEKSVRLKSGLFDVEDLDQSEPEVDLTGDSESIRQTNVNIGTKIFSIDIGSDKSVNNTNDAQLLSDMDFSDIEF